MRVTRMKVHTSRRSQAILHVAHGPVQVILRGLDDWRAALWRNGGVAAGVRLEHSQL